MLAQVPHHMEQGEERDGEGGQEETEAQRQGHNTHRYQDSTEWLFLQFLFPTSRYVLGSLSSGGGGGGGGGGGRVGCCLFLHWQFVVPRSVSFFEHKCLSAVSHAWGVALVGCWQYSDLWSACLQSVVKLKSVVWLCLVNLQNVAFKFFVLKYVSTAWVPPCSLVDTCPLSLLSSLMGWMLGESVVGWD